MDSLDFHQSLIKWLKTFEVDNNSEHLEELSNGIIMAQVLLQIAPDYFMRLNSSIHSDVAMNWRLKVNNLKKILKCLEEYYQDVLGLHLLDSAKPNLMKIGEHSDLIEIGKLLRLILGCAVNCEDKQKYITRIMAMEELVQQNIMQAIQQLEASTHGRGRSSLSLLGVESDTKYQRLLSDLEAVTESKDILSQKCYNLEKQIMCLTEEKFLLSAENNRLLNNLKKLENLQNSNDEIEGGTLRNTEMRKQLETLKEDLLKMETQRDDFRIKIMEQEKDISILQEKITELQSTADKAAQLKDEVDALNETADKVKALELTVSSYKKKLEEYTDFKKKYKILKEENNECYQQNIKLEEELKKNLKYKSQWEIYKKQVDELHQKVDDEMQKIDKLLFENKKLESKLTVLQREKECLIEERDALKETNEELRFHHQRQNVEEKSAVACELAPTELQTRIKHLEHENLSLKLIAEDSTSKQLLLDDAIQRLEKIIEQNRISNQRILELEAQLEELSNSEESLYKQKCFMLQEQLTSRENDIQIAVDKYKKSLEKAKEIIKQLEFEKKCHPIIKMEESNIKCDVRMKVMREEEERLLATCFYKLGLICHREAIDEKFALLTSQGHSFLSRQRQSIPRRSIQLYKSK